MGHRQERLLGEQNFEEEEGFAGGVGGDDAGAGRERVRGVPWQITSRYVPLRSRIKILKREFGGNTDVDVAEALEA